MMLAGGTVLFIIAMGLACHFVGRHVAEHSKPKQLESNMLTTRLGVCLGFFFSWVVWISCYLHQMYPLIEPKLEHSMLEHE
jgi:hypothetical protein